MDDFKGRYSLVSESLEDGSREVFDFSDGIKDFVPVEYTGLSRVALSKIDGFTASFENFQELNDYLLKRRSIRREFPTSRCSIQYKSNSTGEDTELSPVWNDELLQQVACNSNGSKVNFGNETTKNAFNLMYTELMKRDGEFRKSVISSTYKTTSVNNYNKELIEQAASNPSDTVTLARIVKSFSSYREYRALYLGYKNYINAKYKKGPNEPSK